MHSRFLKAQLEDATFTENFVQALADFIDDHHHSFRRDALVQLTASLIYKYVRFSKV